MKKFSEDAIYIPLDVTVDMLSKLPVKSLAKFQCVSKLWSSVITDLIKTQNLTQPRLLLVFQPDHLLFHPLYFFSYAYPPNTTNQVFISADKKREIPCGLNYHSYRYVNGLICCWSSSKQFAIYNHTTKQSVLLPKRVCDAVTFVDVLFGYDPVENQYKVFSLHKVYNKVDVEYTCQVFTLGGPKEQQWRNININNNFSQRRSYGERSVCINGIIYYRSIREGEARNVLGTCDVRFERFDRIQMPETLLNQYWNSTTPVHYQGTLGCIRVSHVNCASAEMWIMEDHIGKQEWSNIIFSITPSIVNYDTCISGVTRDGEIVTKWIDNNSDETHICG